MCEFALSLFRLLYPDGDYGDHENRVAAICQVLAVQYAGEDNETALHYLESRMM